MKKLSIIYSLLCLLFFVLNSFMISCSDDDEESDIITFEKVLYGSMGKTVFQIDDGGYVYCGRTLPEFYKHADLFIVKTNKYGDELWLKKVEYVGNPDEIFDMDLTSDGGYIICRSLSLSYEDNRVLLIKLDSEGNIEWDKFYLPTGDFKPSPYSVQQTADNGYVIAGYVYNNPYQSFLIKTDDKGNEEWIKFYGSLHSNCVYSTVQTKDNGFIFCGFTSSDTQNVWLVKTDSSGNVEWEKTYGGAYTDQGRCVLETNNGYIVLGITFSYGQGSSDIYLIKTDYLGNEEWSRTFGGEKKEKVYSNSLSETSNNGYIITGYTRSFGAGNSDLYLIKVDSSGVEEWSKQYGGLYSDSGSCVKQSSDGGYIICGSNTSNYEQDPESTLYLIKTNQRGEIE